MQSPPLQIRAVKVPSDPNAQRQMAEHLIQLPLRNKGSYQYQQHIGCNTYSR